VGAAVLGVLAARSGAAPQAPATTPTFPSGVELITIDAVVLDAEGRPVSGLTRDDFVVREDGRPRAIESFEAISLRPEPEEVAPAPAPVVATNTAPPEQSGRAFAVLVDDLGISRQETPAVRHAVRDFIDHDLVDGDEVTLGSTSGSAWWSARIPEGEDDLRAVLERVEGSRVDTLQTDLMTEYEAFWIVNHEIGGQNPMSTGDMLLLGNIRERVIQRWMSRGQCGDPSHNMVGNCAGMVQAAATSIDAARRDRDRHTLDAVRRAFDALAPVHGRTSLLLFSPGFVQDKDLPLAQVTAASREAHTAVYFVDARGVMTDAGIGDASAPELLGDPGQQNRLSYEQRNLTTLGAQDLADDTGGFSVRNTNDLAGAARRIADESRVFYLLGFRASGEGSADQWRKLEVEVRRPGLKVRARRGYTLRSAAIGPAPSPRGKKNDKKEKKGKGESVPEPAPAVKAILGSVHTVAGIPLRAMVYVLEPMGIGALHVRVAAELDARRLVLRESGGERVADLDIAVTATQRDTGRGFLHNDQVEMAVKGDEPLGWRGLVREFQLPPGVHQVRVVVRDRSSGKMGAVTQRFEVPFPGELRISTPILTDQLVPGSAEQKRPQPALAAHRTFLATGGLYCQFEVFGAGRDPRTGGPRVDAGLEIQTPQGRVVRRVEPTPISPDASGRLVRLLGMGLDGMEEGPYELVLSIHDEVKDARLEDREAFAVARALP
jgi:VWFA-related protein